MANPFEIIAQSQRDTTKVFESLNNQIDKAAARRSELASQQLRGAQSLAGLRLSERRLDLSEAALNHEKEMGVARLQLDRGRISAGIQNDILKFKQEDQAFKLEQIDKKYKQPISNAYEHGNLEEIKRLEAQKLQDIEALEENDVGDLSGLESSLNIVQSVGLNRVETFGTQFEQDPDLKRLLFASAAAEANSSAGYAPYMETVMNRAMATGRSLRSILSDKGYYPGTTKAKLGRSKFDSSFDTAFNKVMRGSNTTNFATDNASSGVAKRRLAAGNPGVIIDDELFYTNVNGSGTGGNSAHAAWRKKQIALSKKAKGGKSELMEAAKAKEVVPPKLNNEFGFIDSSETYTNYIAKATGAGLPKANIMALDARIKTHSPFFKKVRNTGLQSMYYNRDLNVTSSNDMDSNLNSFMANGGTTEEFSEFAALWSARNQALGEKLSAIKSYKELLKDSDEINDESFALLANKEKEAVNKAQAGFDENDKAMRELLGMPTEPEFVGPPGSAAGTDPNADIPDELKGILNRNVKTAEAPVAPASEIDRSFSLGFSQSIIEQLGTSESRKEAQKLNDSIIDRDFQKDIERIATTPSDKINESTKKSLDSYKSLFESEIESMSEERKQTEFEKEKELFLQGSDAPMKSLFAIYGGKSKARSRIKKLMEGNGLTDAELKEGLVLFKLARSIISFKDSKFKPNLGRHGI